MLKKDIYILSDLNCNVIKSSDSGATALLDKTQKHDMWFNNVVSSDSIILLIIMGHQDNHPPQ